MNTMRLRSGAPRKFTEVGLIKLNMYYIYILKSEKDNSHYIGLTANLRERVKQHNQHCADYSSTKAPYKLIWFCAFKNKKKALSFEKYLKSSSGFAFRNKRLV